MRPSLLTWLCTSLSGFASVWWSFPALLPNLMHHARLAPIPRLPIFVWSFSRSLSSPTRDLQQTAVLSARGLHHCTWRLRCCLLEVGHRYVLDLAASHHRGHLCSPLHLCRHCSFLRDHDLFLKLFVITSTRSFQVSPHFTWDISLVELERRISAAFLTVITRHLCN